MAIELNLPFVWSGPGMSSYAKLHQSCIISSSLGSLSERLQLPKIVPMAVDHAIAEIIFPTVERSVTIGRMTTIELINKVGPESCTQYPTSFAAKKSQLDQRCIAKGWSAS